MDILKYSQLVIFSHSTIFITFSYKSLAGFLFKLLQSSSDENRKWRQSFAFECCVAWSKDSNFALKPIVLLNPVLLSTKQMSSHHKFVDGTLNLTVGGNPLERDESTKKLGVHIHSNLKWVEYIKQLAICYYGSLATLKKMKNFTNYKLRKHAESLVLSRLDFKASAYSVFRCLFCYRSLCDSVLLILFLS